VPDTFESTGATVYAGEAAMIIQQYTGNADALIWGGNDGWKAEDSSVQVLNTYKPSFGDELNVGGKVIYGLSEGGWRPTSAGSYRLSFAVPADSNAQLGEAGGDGDNLTNPSGTDLYGDISYLDIKVVPSGGGGGGGGRPRGAVYTPSPSVSTQSLNNVMPDQSSNWVSMSGMTTANCFPASVDGLNF
jgi:hypothetical protein